MPPSIRTKRIGVRTTFIVFASVLLLIFGAMSAMAVHDLDFQLDGNTDPAVYGGSTSAQPVDWESLVDDVGVNDTIGKKTGALPSGFTAVGFAAPPGANLATDESGDFHLPDATVFATGSKDTLNISDGWQCKKANNVGDKVDILNAYSAIYVDPATNHTILYFGVEKSSPNGDSNIAVWFLQDDDIACSSSGGGNQSFTGDHEDGDLLLVSAFTNGGTQANVAAYAWDGGADGSLPESPVATGALCGTADQPSTPTSDQEACAITNGSDITVPWKSPDKDGGDLNGLEFFEGAVDLTATGLGDVCFSRFLANTRSSQSLTATIFDFAEGPLAACNPATDVTPSFTTPSGGTAHYGDSLTLTITEQNTGNTPLTLAFLGKTTLASYVTTDNTDCNSTLAYASGDANTNGILDPGETWTYTCTFNAPSAPSTPVPDDSLTVTATGRGYDPVGRLVTYFTGCTSNTTYVCDSNEQQSTSINLINPSTELTARVSVQVTYTYYEKNDGNDPLSSPSVSDPTCVAKGGTVSQVKESSNTYNVGDVDPDGSGTETPNGLLDPGETWQWQCQITLTPNPTASPAVQSIDVTNTATGSGTDAVGETVTFCPTVGVTPTNTLCDDQEVDSTRVLVDNIAGRPTPTPSPSASP